MENILVRGKIFIKKCLGATQGARGFSWDQGDGTHQPGAGKSAVRESVVKSNSGFVQDEIHFSPEIPISLTELQCPVGKSPIV